MDNAQPDLSVPVPPIIAPFPKDMSLEIVNNGEHLGVVAGTIHEPAGLGEKEVVDSGVRLFKLLRFALAAIEDGIELSIERIHSAEILRQHAKVSERENPHQLNFGFPLPASNTFITTRSEVWSPTILSIGVVILIMFYSTRTPNIVSSYTKSNGRCRFSRLAYCLLGIAIVIKAN